MRPPVEPEHDVFDSAEVRLVVVLVVAVHRDVAGIPALRGAEPVVVRVRDAHLDRERDPQPPVVDHLSHRPQRLGHGGARDRVLHLAEAHRARAHEHVVRVIREGAVAVDLRREPVDRRGQRRHRTAQVAERGEHGVADEPVLPPFGEGADRMRFGVGGQPRVGLRGDPVAVREPVELEVVDRSRPCLEVVEHRIKALGALDRVHHEGRHALDGELHDDAERPQPEPCGGQQLGVGALVDPQHRAVRGDERHAHHLGGEPAEGRTGAVGSGGGGAGDGLAVDVAHVGEREAEGSQDAGQLVQVGPGPEADPPGRRVVGPQPVEAAQVEHDAVAGGDGGEAVARADRLDGEGVLARERHDRHDLVDARGTCRVDGVRLLGARPVAPGLSRNEIAGRGRRHRNTCPSPR